MNPLSVCSILCCICVCLISMSKWSVAGTTNYPTIEGPVSSILLGPYGAISSTCLLIIALFFLFKCQWDLSQ